VVASYQDSFPPGQSYLNRLLYIILLLSSDGEVSSYPGSEPSPIKAPSLCRCFSFSSTTLRDLLRIARWCFFFSRWGRLLSLRFETFFRIACFSPGANPLGVLLSPVPAGAPWLAFARFEANVYRLFDPTWSSPPLPLVVRWRSYPPSSLMSVFSVSCISNWRPYFPLDNKLRCAGTRLKPHARTSICSFAFRGSWCGIPRSGHFDFSTLWVPQANLLASARLILLVGVSSELLSALG